MSVYLGVDVGGTNVKWALLERRAHEWALGEIGSAATHAGEGPEAVVERVGAIAARAIASVGGVESVGVGVPGVFDKDRGIALLLPNLPGDWNGVALRQPIEAASGTHVALVNDARAFALAELALGAGRGSETAVFVTLGTGVGGGVAVGGRLHLGREGRAGEVGHVTVDTGADAPQCGCGNRGCAEAFTTAQAIASSAERATVKEVVEAARAGDGRARRALDRAGFYIGVALANAVVLLAPERIVVGGGVVGAGDLLLDPLRRELTRRVHVSSPVAVVAAELGVHAGAVGAAAWAATATEPVPTPALAWPGERPSEP